MSIELVPRPQDAVRGAHAVHTDTWVSMGQENDKDTRRRAFEGFTVDSQMMELADPSAIFMHCLPAHRGDEVTSDVFDSSVSVVFDQAENRLHMQKAILTNLLGKRSGARR